jgi:hypothetical protein
MKKIIKILIGISILFLLIGSVVAAENIRPVTTPYNTTAQLDIGGGLITDETTVTEEGQVLAFEDGWNKGYFISTSKENAADLINTITSQGTKCRDDNIVWYHMKDSHLANSYSVFGGTHLKLESNEYDIGYLENPNSDEVIILMAGPTKIVDCFKSVNWG